VIFDDPHASKQTSKPLKSSGHRPELHLTTGGHDLIPVGRLCGNLPQPLQPTPTRNPEVIAGFGVVQSYQGSYGNTGRWHGPGTILFQLPFDGDTSTPASYSGDFFNGDMHGMGVFTWRDGTEYNGQVCFNKLTGHATLSWPHASDRHLDTYNGQVEESVRQGSGVFIKRNARGQVVLTYEGDWVRGLRCGQGRLSFGEAQIEWYEGGWEHGCKSGQGKMQWRTGNIYTGEWLNDLRHGSGRMQWLDANHVYDGLWREGKQHGYGMQVWLSPEADEAQGADFVLAGRLPTLNKYAGEWQHGCTAFSKSLSIVALYTQVEILVC